MENFIYKKRYELLKRKMNETTKGFWRVKSLCILNRNLNKKYNPKDALMKKAIERIVPKLPNYIKIRPIHILYKKKKEENLKLKQQIFLTGQNRNSINNKNNTDIQNKSNSTFNELFGKFPYEPFLYNEYLFKVFPVYKKEQRTFSQCVQDSRELSENYKKNVLPQCKSQKQFNRNYCSYNKKNSQFKLYKRNTSSINLFENYLNNNRYLIKKKQQNNLKSDINIKY